MSGALSVRKALETRLASMVPLLATQWENRAFKPSAGTPYQKVDLLFAEPINEEIGRQFQEQGYLQVSLRYPVGTSAADALTKAQAVRDWFPKGLPMIADGLTVNVNKIPSISPATIDGDRYCVLVKIRFLTNSLV